MYADGKRVGIGQRKNVYEANVLRRDILNMYRSVG